ncbi:hypothetical protein JXA02_02775 [candidate division KSB1 bacterium]|nr:hypothetical protein [candidate division KSB1 bacterium]RQW10019.1 MAG: hypothetical protein EH222_03025 [candidate division KSB1 bacterium]
MEKFHSLLPVLKERFEKELVREMPNDTDQLIGLPNAYVTPGKEKRDALYYWDTYFINLGLIRLKLIDLARYNAENLIFLQRKFGFVPASNSKSSGSQPTLPLLPWIIRDVYRATGDKDWLSRMLPDVINEFHYWTMKPHTTPVGLYRFTSEQNNGSITSESSAESCWLRSIRFAKYENYNPVDLNALLYRDAILIHDLQIEADGKGDSSLLQKSEHIKKMFPIFWNEEKRFYFDNNFAEKRLSDIKTVAGYMPLFVELIDQKQADTLQKHLTDFVAPGGITTTDMDYENNSGRSYPLLCAPSLYFVIKGLSDYEFMEDAADIGANWLTMVHDLYEETGEMWEWYNVQDRSIASPKGVRNTPILGWTAGTYVALLDTLGLE